LRRISRRRFFGGAAALLGAAELGRGLRADPFGWPIGCQTWPVRESIGRDFAGTLAGLAADGYRRIEMCSPPSYSDSGFGPLASMPAAALREKIHAAGLGCESCHFGFDELKESLDARMAWAKELGLTQMIISSFDLPRTAKLSDWAQAAQAANKLGERTRQAGFQLGYHNHDMEFHKLDGELIYDRLMSELDPKLVRMQFQVSVVRLGYHAADYFEKYPGRFISMHLQDWSDKEHKEVALGQGIVDWKRLFAAARTGGVKNYFVEMDPPELKASVPYLHTLS
jgi:sugar phosphate isomerase/epimerase